MKTNPYILAVGSPAREEPVLVSVQMSMGLAQFLTQIQMCDHPDFDSDNIHHQGLIAEFAQMKKDIYEKVQPVIDFHLAIEELLNDVPKK